MLVLLGAAVLLGACSGSASEGPTTAQSRALRIPLASSAVVPSSLVRSNGRPSSRAGPEAWAIVEMGGDGAAGSQTWQLFRIAGAHHSWSLATPAGVGSGGGLVAAFVEGAGVVGVVPSSHLGFSPLATEGAGGTLLSLGALPGPLTPVPGALAAAAAARLLALLGSAGSSLLSSSDAGASTETLARLPVLAQEAQASCDLVALTAASYGPLLRPLAGGRCLASGRLGIFQLTRSGWRLVGPVLPGAAVLGGVPSGASGAGVASAAASQAVDTQVVRLWSDGSDVMALALAVSANGTTSLFRLTRGTSTAWQASSVFDVPPSEHLVATGTGAGGATFALLSGSDGLTALVLGSGTAAWRELPSPPAGTATLALGVGTGAGAAGATEALVVRQQTLEVYALRPSGSWDEVQALAVPVP